jgi:hypothetical protein
VATFLTTDKRTKEETTSMSKKSALILACSLLGSIFSLNVQALPVSFPPKSAAVSYVTPVRGFCAPRFHRGLHGRCVRNDVRYSYPPLTSAPPDLVAPLACMYGYHLFPYDGCFAPTCTYGYYLGPYGQCFPYWRAL